MCSLQSGSQFQFDQYDFNIGLQSPLLSFDQALFHLHVCSRGKYQQLEWNGPSQKVN